VSLPSRELHVTRPDNMSACRVDMLVVTGFLGAGKTTLMHRLLAHAAAAHVRLGVLINDVGSVNLDGIVRARLCLCLCFI
jgi:putative protein kinase ArgK-like GTPase of G3E family